MAGIVPVAALASQSEARPNILFILSDDHTSQTWGIYGGHLADYARTDNIQRLAREGVTLDNCYCTNSISTPSAPRYSQAATATTTACIRFPTLSTLLCQP